MLKEESRLQILVFLKYQSQMRKYSNNVAHQPTLLQRYCLIRGIGVLLLMFGVRESCFILCCMELFRLKLIIWMSSIS